MSKTKKKSTLHSPQSPVSNSGQPTTTPPVERKNPIHSVLTALPVIMLAVGLTVYYSNEKKQRGGALVLAQMVQYAGNHSGVSTQGEKEQSQRILWVNTKERLRGSRIDYQQFKILREEKIEKGAAVEVWAAPRIAGSDVLWLVKLVVSGLVLVDQTPR